MSMININSYLLPKLSETLIQLFYFRERYHGTYVFIIRIGMSQM